MVVCARQTGKPTALRQASPDHHYVTLDLPSEAASAGRDPVAFLARHPRPLIVDEVQYAPARFRQLKPLVDAGDRAPGQLILAGSQKFALMQGVAESLAGRTAVLTLEPLAVAELLPAGLVQLANADAAALCQRGACIDLIACKWTELPTARDAKSMARVAAALERTTGLTIRRQLVACRTGHEGPLGPMAKTVPDIAAATMLRDGGAGWRPITQTSSLHQPPK